MDEQWKYNPETNEITVRRFADIGPVIEANKKLYNAASDYRPFAKGEMHHVADIPMIVLEQWMKEDGVNYLAGDGKDKLIARLNNSDFRGLRTKPGHL